jgi:hypothetical protein
VSIIAFRRWQVDDDGLLRPLRMQTSTRWTPGPVRAVCHCGGIGGWWPRLHERPELGQPGSSCGFYSYKQPIAGCTCSTPDDASHGAVGVVRIWGRIVEHTDGWRSEYAQPVALVDFTGSLSTDYELARYPDLDSMYGEWAPDLEPCPDDGPGLAHQLTGIAISVRSSMTSFAGAVASIQASMNGLASSMAEAAEQESYRIHCRALGLDDATADQVLAEAEAQPIWQGSKWETATRIASLRAACARAAQAWRELAAVVDTVEKATRPAPVPKTGPPQPSPGHRAYGKRRRGRAGW